MIQRDKILHFIAGMALAFIVGLYNPWVGLVTAMFAGVCKEYVKDNGQLLKLWPSGPSWLVAPGTVDWRDLAATTIGGYVGAFVSLLIIS